MHSIHILTIAEIKSTTIYESAHAVRRGAYKNEYLERVVGRAVIKKEKKKRKGMLRHPYVNGGR